MKLITEALFNVITRGPLDGWDTYKKYMGATELRLSITVEHGASAVCVKITNIALVSGNRPSTNPVSMSKYDMAITRSMEFKTFISSLGLDTIKRLPRRLTISITRTGTVSYVVSYEVSKGTSKTIQVRDASALQALLAMYPNTSKRTTWPI